ncbi:MAG: hypothetical protein QXO71_08885 [Candidatus Jordarchaeaceae archaeon]
MDTSNKIINEVDGRQLTRLDLASISLAVELGMDPIDAYNLVCELRDSSPDYHKRIQEIAQLYLEARFALHHLLREIDEIKQLKRVQTHENSRISQENENVLDTSMQTTAETTVNNSLLQIEKTLSETVEKIEEQPEESAPEKVEEKILDELRRITSEQEKTEKEISEKLCETAQSQSGVEEKISEDKKSSDNKIVEYVQEELTGILVQDAKENIPATEQVNISEQVLGEVSLENKEKIKEWLNSVERSFNEMPLEKQEEVMSRYTQLRALTCKSKKEIDASCIGCLIVNTIDCPLFNRTSKRR